MDNSEIFPHIDHTLLRATATEEEISKLCKEALLYKTASVCIPASYVKFARKHFPELNICTVIGFPLGYSTTAVKCAEARDAVQNGVDEIDMVINLGWVKDGKFPEVQREIAYIKAACGCKILKVIIETCYLTEQEKIELCKCVTDAKADYIKTSTGFGTAGANIEDIRLFKRHIGKDVKIKAAGGVKTKSDLEMFLNEGCERIGTSSAVKLLAGEG
ncbi:MAG: deoxyribose-phosphate aldolase [Lachnospiraceae bacterium]|nr:deoxyribose-phosphate aldolase [Ruminococcus sp.]MCM1274006.1 deoxyribose-phosphate aldolase [Lachnospiraceae bacterium]